MMRNEPTWRNSEFRTVAKGLRTAQDRSFAFSNFAHPSDLFRILDHEANRSTLARVAYISCLFYLRVHSDTLQPQRASAADPLLKFLPQEPKALIGVQTFEEIQVLAIESKYRKTFADVAY